MRLRLVGMAEVKVDPDVFWLRIMKLHKAWNVSLDAYRPCCSLPEALSGRLRRAVSTREGRPVQGR